MKGFWCRGIREQNHLVNRPSDAITSSGKISVSLYFVVFFCFCVFVQISAFSLVVCAVLKQLFYCHFVSQNVVVLNHGGRSTSLQVPLILMQLYATITQNRSQKNTNTVYSDPCIFIPE